MTVPNKAVFLSYASQDAEAAARICASLRAAGVEVWFDQSELRGGDAWDQRIRRQIRDCVLFIPLISEHTQARPEGYFRLEWDLADQRTHMVSRNKAFIVPVCIDHTPGVDADVPDTFLKVQWTRIPEGQAAASFSARVAALVNGTAMSAPPQALAVPALSTAREPSSRRWVVVVFLGVVVASAIAWQVWRMVPTRAAPAHRTLTAEVPVSTVPEKSIAVLPFVDMSEKHDQEYFSDGLSEELIDHLSHNANLKVIARTSSFAFKGKNEDMRTIAAKLGVANLLEGSVRRVATELRITAQLIRATDGVHLWSQTYERKLTDIFKVQDEISTTVARELNVALGAPSGPVAVGTTTMAAYNLMLQGNYFFYRGGTGDTGKAITFYRQATAVEPRNALAWARTAEAYVELARERQLSFEEARSQAQATVRRALAVDPDLARAHYVLGNIYRELDLDWDAASAEYERAVTLDARGDVASDARFNSTVIEAIKSGRVDAPLRLLTQDIVRNPLDAPSFYLLGRYQYMSGHLEGSAAAFRKLLELSPSYVGAQAHYAMTLLTMGEDAEALTAAEKESDERPRLFALTCVYWTMRRRGDSDAAMKKLEGSYANTGAYLAAHSHACRGEVDLTFEWLERAYRQRDGNLEVIKIDPWLRLWRGDPRYKALLRKLKLPET